MDIYSSTGVSEHVESELDIALEGLKTYSVAQCSASTTSSAAFVLFTLPRS